MVLKKLRNEWRESIAKKNRRGAWDNPIPEYSASPIPNPLPKPLMERRPAADFMDKFAMRDYNGLPDYPPPPVDVVPTYWDEVAQAWKPVGQKIAAGVNAVPDVIRAGGGAIVDTAGKITDTTVPIIGRAADRTGEFIDDRVEGTKRLWKEGQAPKPIPNELEESGFTGFASADSWGPDGPNPYGPLYAELDKTIAENTAIAQDAASKGDTATATQATENVRQAQQQKQQIEEIYLPPLPEGRDSMVTAPTYEQFENAPRIPVSMAEAPQGATPGFGGGPFEGPGAPNIPREGIKGVIDELKGIGQNIANNPSFNDALIQFGQNIAAAGGPSAYNRGGLENIGNILGAGVRSFNENLIDTEQFADDPNAIPRIQQLMAGGLTGQEATATYLSEKADRDKLLEQRQYNLELKDLEEQKKKDKLKQEENIALDDYNGIPGIQPIDANDIRKSSYTDGQYKEVSEKRDNASNTNKKLARLKTAITQLAAVNGNKWFDYFGTSGAIKEFFNKVWGKANPYAEEVKQAMNALTKEQLNLEPGAKTDFDFEIASQISGDILAFNDPNKAIEWVDNMVARGDKAFREAEGDLALANQGYRKKYKIQPEASKEQPVENIKPQTKTQTQSNIIEVNPAFD